MVIIILNFNILTYKWYIYKLYLLIILLLSFCEYNFHIRISKCLHELHTSAWKAYQTKSVNSCFLDVKYSQRRMDSVLVHWLYRKQKVLNYSKRSLHSTLDSNLLKSHSVSRLFNLSYSPDTDVEYIISSS